MKKYKAIIYDLANMPQLLAKELHQVQESGVPTAMVTNLSKKCYQTLDDWDLHPMVEVSGFFFDRFGHGRKPHPDLLLVAAARLEIDTSNILSLCHNDADVQASQAAGMGVMMVDDVREINDIYYQMENSYVAPTYGGIEAIPDSPLMGTICGDIIGIPFEHAVHRTKDYNFPVLKSGHFSDDTLLTLAIADWLMGERTDGRLVERMRLFGRQFATCGFSRATLHWLFQSNMTPYGSKGNGAAMRVGAIGWAAQSLDEALTLAKQSATVTHNTEEGVRGAQSIAVAIYLTRTGKSKEMVKTYIENTFGYDLSLTPEQIRPTYTFDGTCDGSVPQAICCWLYSNDYEQTIRNAVSLGGDADTIAAMAGSIAAATPGWTIPEKWVKKCYSKLPNRLKHVIHTFNSYII